ncbi:MAG: DUF3971 domain-containing protein [Pseudomonadota bacterium]
MTNADANAQAELTPTRRRRGLRALLVLFVVVVCLLGALYGAARYLQSKPMAAGTWVTTQVIERVNDVLPQGRIAFRSIRVGLDPTLRPQVYLNDVTLSNADGLPLAQLREVQGDIAISPLLRGELDLRRITLSGAILRLDRRGDGSFDLSLGSAGASVDEAGSLSDLLADIDAFFDRPEVARLEEVFAEAVTVNYTDAVSGQAWTGDGGQMRLVQDAERLLITSDVAVLTGRQDLALVSLTFERDGQTGAAQVAAVVEDAAASDIAAQTPALAWLEVVDATISGALAADIDASGVGDLTASLELSDGVLQPTADTRPIPFTGAELQLDYAPDDQRLTFERLAVDSAWGRATVQGTATLADFDGPFPSEIVGQFTLQDVAANPRDLYEAPRSVDAGAVDLRLRLNPFTLDIGQAVVHDGDTQAVIRGRVSAPQDGWDVALSARTARIGSDRVMHFWPVSLKPNTRKWFANNILGGDLLDVTAAVRARPGAQPDIALTHHFEGASVQILRSLPPVTDASGSVTIADHAATVQVAAGTMTPPQGGRLDASGTVFRIGDMRQKPPMAHVDISAAGTVTAMLSLLDQPPMAFMSKANLPVTLADGVGRAEGFLSLPIRPRPPRETIDFDFGATLRNVVSETLVDGRRLAAPALDVRVRPDGIRVAGTGTLDGVAWRGAWAQPLGQGPQPSQIEGEVTINPAALDAFGIALPPGTIRGEGTGQLSVALPRGAPPEFSLSSNTRGITIAIPPLGWTKPAGTSGRFDIAGRLGPNPSVERLALSAAGLDAQGALALTAGGQGLERARFSTLRLGDWLNADVTLTPQGAGAPLAVQLEGGTLDLRRATFGGQNGGGDGPPLAVALDRVTISDGITLTGFRADLTTNAGLRGGFTARMNGGAPLSGRLEPGQHGSTIIIQGEDGGGLIRDAGLMPNVRGGQLALTLTPQPEDGQFIGDVTLRDIRVRDAPAMAALLSAVSVVGLLEQLDGNGLFFNEVEGRFRLTPDRVIIAQSSAVGPSLGVSLDGIFGLRDREMDFQGVVSPLYLLNGIGSIFTRRGEGLIGFNFNLTGVPGAPRVSVNPFSILTPAMFREIFRRPPPDVGQ